MSKFGEQMRGLSVFISDIRNCEFLLFLPLHIYIYTYGIHVCLVTGLSVV